MDCSLIGFGNFSRQAAVYLKDYFDIFTYDVNPDVTVPDFVCKTDVLHALSKDIIILSTPVQCMENFLEKYAGYIKSGALFFDIGSVKVKPFNCMKKYLADKNIYFLGTHPLFGPQTMKGGVKGHKIVLTPENRETDEYKKICSFLRARLELDIIEMTPDEHDREMAVVQALNHFIVRGLKQIELKETPVSTPSYKKLYDLYENLRYDSDALFYTIQRENPYADSIRKKFIDVLTGIEGDIVNEG